MSGAASGADRFRCLLCGSVECAGFLSGCRDLFSGFEGEWDYVRCGGCGLVQIFPVPADPGRFYVRYPVHAKKSGLYEAARSRFMRAGYYFPGSGLAGARLIDYGCGDGWYLAEAARLGAEVVGFEPDPEVAAAVAERTGLVIESDRERLSARVGGRCDVVTFHWVFEHVTDLWSAFDDALSLAAPGGLVYFLVPNIGSREFRMFGRRWNGLDAPRHISFPEERHFRSLCGGRGARLESARVLGMPNTVAGSVSNLLAGRFDPRVFALSMVLAIPLSGFADGHLGVVVRKD